MAQALGGECHGRGYTMAHLLTVEGGKRSLMLAALRN